MRIAISIGTALIAATALLAQGPFSRLADPTGDVPGIVWNPQVGQGSQYDITTHNGSRLHVTLTIVGKESVEGQTGYWLETAVDSDFGQIFSQRLTTLSDGRLRGGKWIVQIADKPPMEMPAARTNSSGQSDPDFRSSAVRVGVESITVPGGTFACEHWRAKDGSGDAWLSSNVVPYSVVKANHKDGEAVILTKTINSAKPQITAKPVPFDPSVLMGAIGRRR